MSYMTQNKKHKQILESAQYGLEISFKLLHEHPWPISIIFTANLHFQADKDSLLHYIVTFSETYVQID